MLLAALALNALARSDAELYLRANCDLRDRGPSAVEIDQRGGGRLSREPLCIEAADALLADALAEAEPAAGVSWAGPALRATGDPAIVAGAVAEDEDGKAEMPFAIVADLPLGTYHGAGQDGQPEPVPSVARLHAALLCAAGFGPRAVSTGPDSLDVREEDQTALRWLEGNPPDSVAIPALRINIVYLVAYRDDGTIKRSGIGGNGLPRSCI